MHRINSEHLLYTIHRWVPVEYSRHGRTGFSMIGQSRGETRTVSAGGYSREKVAHAHREKQNATRVLAKIHGPSVALYPNLGEQPFWDTCDLKHFFVCKNKANK